MYHVMAREALGRRGEVAVYLTVYVTIFLMPAIFHITAVEALGQVGEVPVRHYGSTAVRLT